MPLLGGSSGYYLSRYLSVTFCSRVERSRLDNTKNHTPQNLHSNGTWKILCHKDTTKNCCKTYNELSICEWCVRLGDRDLSVTYGVILCTWNARPTRNSKRHVLQLCSNLQIPKISNPQNLQIPKISNPQNLQKSQIPKISIFDLSSNFENRHHPNPSFFIEISAT